MLCTPNNPTGPALQHQQVIDFIDAIPDHIMIVLDEAYVEFVTDPKALRGLEAMTGRSNVVVLRSFSKAYGLAGFRVGYCVAEADLAAAVRAVSLPFGVSIAAQAAVIASLEAEPLLLDRVADLVKARDALAGGLRDLGFDIPDAQGNFVWLPGGPDTEAYAATFARAGLMVRQYASGGDWDGLRITVGEPAANARVLEVAATLARTPAS
jgi:histidinol-phosphate aminotransferase